MCRHLAWLGPQRSLQSIVVDPPHSLYRQSWQPRRQRHGTVNADGFGVGWFAPGLSRPVQYRRAQPIWTDRSFASLAPAVTSSCVLAAVRSATPPQPVEESGTAPFLIEAGDRLVLFSHNGAVAPEAVRAALPADARPDSSMDSALLAELVRAALLAGCTLPEALASCVRQVGEGRLNLLATDGECVAATTWGDTLSWIRRDGGVLLASEPADDDGGWVDVPDKQVVTARLSPPPAHPELTVIVRPLEAP